MLFLIAFVSLSSLMQKGMELLKKLQDDQIGAFEFALSAEAVDKWIECLDEIASNAYSVRISIQR